MNFEKLPFIGSRIRIRRRINALKPQRRPVPVLKIDLTIYGEFKAPPAPRTRW